MSKLDCKEYQERIVLFLYEELTDPEQADLEIHIQICINCNGLFEEQKSLHAALAEDSGPWTVPSDLLVESRRALADELDRIESKGKRSWWRLPAFSLVFTPMRVLEWTTLVAVGLAGGVYLNSAQNHPAAPVSTVSTAYGSDSESVSNLRIVNSDTTTGNIELVGDMVRPMHLLGNVQDDKVQQLLVGALQDSRNPGARMNAVSVLSQKPNSPQVINALIRALMEDDNCGVRLKALQSLKPFASQEIVRSAIMNALANDEDAGIRVQAIVALQGFAHDDAVSKTVQEVTKNDDNTYVKLQAVQFVGNRQ